MYVTYLSFSSPLGPQGSEGDPEYIFFTLRAHTMQILLVTICDTTAGIGSIFWTDRLWTDGGRTDRRGS